MKFKDKELLKKEGNDNRIKGKVNSALKKLDTLYNPTLKNLHEKCDIIIDEEIDEKALIQVERNLQCSNT